MNKRLDIIFLEDEALYIGKNFSKDLYEKIFRMYYKGLCFYAQNFIKDINAIEDIVHDIFINLWEKRETITEEKSIKSYLYRSVHNRCLNFIRDNKKFANTSDFIENSELASSEDNHEAFETAELEVKIQNAIDSLPKKCKEVFLLSRHEELKYSEIAEKLQISIKTVENQISKALKVLRQQLGDYLTAIIFVIIVYNFFTNVIGVTNI